MRARLTCYARACLARQRAQHIRLLLEYTGERYKETGYLCGPPPGYDKSGWLSVKETLNLDFPNVSMEYRSTEYRVSHDMCM